MGLIKCIVYATCTVIEKELNWAHQFFMGSNIYVNVFCFYAMLYYVYDHYLSLNQCILRLTVVLQDVKTDLHFTS